MRYIIKKSFELIRFLLWWRLGLALVTVALAALAVTIESGGGWFVALAAIPGLVLFSVSGSRTATNHATIKMIQEEVKKAASRPPITPIATPPEPPVIVDQALPATEPAPRSRPDSPDITIIVTVFNERQYILDCLQSIQYQSWSNFECIVVDDASTDNTIEVAYDRFASDQRFQFVSVRANVGLSAARNVGITLARARWITFVDGDDFLFEAAIERRLAQVAPVESNAWIAGAYCNWVSVPEDQVLIRSGKKVPARSRITWLDTLHNSPFVASAPIIRSSIMRALGGFRDVSAAEDADMWTKILRHGYVFLPANYTGVAYRQKAHSMFRREIVEHAAVTTGLHVANYEPKPLEQFTPGTPFAFHQAAPAYITAVESFRRNLIALTTALAQENSAAVEELTALLATTNDPYIRWAIDVDAVIANAAKRSESYESAGAATRAEILIARTHEVVDEILAVTKPGEIGTTPASLPDLSTANAGTVSGAEWVRLKGRHRIRLSAGATGAAVADHVVLMPSAAYHVKELGPLAHALQRRGIPVAFMVSDRRWEWTEPGLRAWEFPVYAFPDDMDWTKAARAIVALNDWGEPPRDAILAANEFGVPTFAKVEGVQDFDDTDVKWTRRAYQTAAHVLCQGKNDTSALPSSVDTHVVGSSRLETIWADPPRPLGPELAVVNLNFTYGVLTDARDMWVDTVIGAGEKAGIPVVFSLHPAETNRPRGAMISDLPISHLLTKASVHVSRFSTVPFEAMARGVPFVYHNPHGEMVPTFLDPRDAYEVSATADELAEAMIKTREYADSYRAKCEGFFREQIDIDPRVPSAERTAAVIQRIVTDG